MQRLGWWLVRAVEDEAQGGSCLLKLLENKNILQ